MRNPFTHNFEMRVRDSFRLYSQRLNAFITLVVIPYIITTNGGFVADLIDKLPTPYKLLLAPFAGFAAFWLVTWCRLHTQEKKGDAQ